MEMKTIWDDKSQCLIKVPVNPKVEQHSQKNKTNCMPIIGQIVKLIFIYGFCYIGLILVQDQLAQFGFYLSKLEILGWSAIAGLAILVPGFAYLFWLDSKIPRY